MESATHVYVCEERDTESELETQRAAEPQVARSRVPWLVPGSRPAD